MWNISREEIEEKLEEMGYSPSFIPEREDRYFWDHDTGLTYGYEIISEEPLEIEVWEKEEEIESYYQEIF